MQHEITVTNTTTSTSTTTTTTTIYGSLDFVWDNQSEQVQEEAFTHSHYRGHQSSLVCFLHLLQS